MAIRLVTGVPGSGKTLLCIDDIVHNPDYKDRPVFYYGINGLVDELGWTEIFEEDLIDAFENKTDKELKHFDAFGAGAIIVIDEVQILFPTQPSSRALPPFIQWCQTHRHHGNDIFLTSQHPSQLNHGLRILAGDFWYIERQRRISFFSPKKVPIIKYSWGTFRSDYMNQAGKKAGLAKEFLLPERSYKYYKSAEQHTHKQKMNRYQVILPTLFISIAGLVFFLGKSLVSMSKQGQPELDSSVPTISEAANEFNSFDPTPEPFSEPDNDDEYEIDMAYVTIISEEAIDPFFDGSLQPRNPEKFGGCSDTNGICYCFTVNLNIYDLTNEQCREILANDRKFTTYFHYPDNAQRNSSHAQ